MLVGAIARDARAVGFAGLTGSEAQRESEQHDL
jgi:hypothetical protein